jgi:uncharacterized protein
VNSLDTNVLIYAANEDAPEHPKAKLAVEKLLKAPEEWILADQVLIEFYRALRNPAVFQKPAGAGEAWEIVNFYREEAGSRRCCYELSMWRDLERHLKSSRFEARKTFDALLAVTLLNNGVETFYTRNTKDFRTFGFRSVINPID